MKKHERLAHATAPDGTVLELYRHDAEYIIRADGAELMSTRRHHTEELLADLVCAQLHDRADARVLIGGLGLAFTLRAALTHLRADAQAVVAEIVAEVADWNRNPEFRLGSDVLADDRVEVRIMDVADAIRDTSDGFDAIMLDVDNGANAITNASNSFLYSDAGIRTVRAALRPDGRVAYWSAEADPKFEASLRRAGLTIDATQARAYETSGKMHTLYVAYVARSGPAPAPNAIADSSA